MKGRPKPINFAALARTGLGVDDLVVIARKRRIVISRADLWDIVCHANKIHGRRLSALRRAVSAKRQKAVQPSTQALLCHD